MTTGTDPLEELEVPHLKKRLWHELAEIHAEHRGSQTAARNTGAELLRRRVRRSLLVAVIGAAAAAVLVVGVFTAQLIGTGANRRAGQDADIVLLVRVAAATDEALAGSVVHSVEEQVFPDGARLTFELWHDQTTGVTRMLQRDGRGNPVYDGGPLTGPTIESPAYSGQRLVDYCRQGYLDLPDTGEAGTVGTGGLDVRDQLANGELVEHGTEVVDGREMIRLQDTDSEGGDYVLLVDPDTYRVVAQRGKYSTGETYSTVYEYLPRTAESLDLLHPPIPAAFTQLNPLGLTFDQDSCDDS